MNRPASIPASPTVPPPVTGEVGRFFGRLVLFLLPLGLVWATAFWFLPRHPDHYLSGFRLKDQRLRATPSPKIILVGGSNLAFGMDSDALADALHQPVVNTALHAGFGLSFMLNAARPHIRSGDTVIIAFEYQHYVARTTRGDATLCELIFEEPTAARYLDLDHLPTLVEGLGHVCGQRLVRTALRGRFHTDTIYNARAFNAAGDVISHLDQIPEPKPTGWLTDATIRRATLRRLAAFIRHAEARGATVHIFPPCYRQTEYARSQHHVEQIYQTLRDRFPRHTRATPAEFVFPPDQFFDTEYHLNRQGRAARAARLARWLQRLQTHPAPSLPVPS